MRKIIEKLKSLCSLRRFTWPPMEEAGETASSTGDQAGPCPLRMRQAHVNLGRHRAGQFGGREAVFLA